MSRRIDKDDLMNPTVVAFDNVGRDWHVRLGSVAGKPFTFVTAEEARQIAEAWVRLGVQLQRREGGDVNRGVDFIDELVEVMRAALVETTVDATVEVRR